MITYDRPYLYPKQEAAIFNDRRWSLCEASTKSGKTVASIVRIIEWGLMGNGRTTGIDGKILSAGPGQNYWWVAPISDQSRIAFSRVKQSLTPGTFTSRESPTPTIHLITGPSIVFKSSDNPDSLYGEDVYGAIIDEASRCRPEAWFAVRSTLTATRGPCVMIGNVKGRRNWFWEFCRRAENGQEPNASFSRITWRDAVDAGVLDLDEIEDAKRNLPEMVFQELYEAVASDDSGNPFGEQHILACIGEISAAPAVAFGVDLAKSQDYLVVIGLDAQGKVCQFHRWKDRPWRDSIKEIHRIVGEDTPALVDSTGVGDPVLEELQVDHGNFRGYNFTATSKQRLMEGLAVSIQGHEIRYPKGPISNELMVFEYELTRTGVRYSAPAGYNDDCVCGLALAREQWTTTAPGAGVMAFYAGEAVRQRQAAQQDLEAESTDEDERFLKAIHQQMPLQQLDNELTELYRATIASYDAPASRLCARCATNVPSSNRVTDGHQVWHQECA